MAEATLSYFALRMVAKNSLLVYKNLDAREVAALATADESLRAATLEQFLSDDRAFLAYMGGDFPVHMHDIVKSAIRAYPADWLLFPILPLIAARARDYTPT